MIPIGKQDWPHIDVIGNVRGTMDDHGSEKATSVLRTVMGVIPRCTVEIGFERIRERLPRSNWTLLNRRYTIEPRVTTLKNAMPVQSSAFFRSGDLVVNGDLESVSPVGF